MTGTPDINVDETAQLMQEHQIKRLLVLENDNNVKGVASLRDVGVEHASGTAGNVVPEVPKRKGNN
ncbi:CBS domain-containing protein [Salibacterium sp. K-3]